MIYTYDQLVSMAQGAGFTGLSAQIVAAIAMAESTGNSQGPDNINNDVWASRDRGLMQINSHWHPEVSDACAYDAVCSLQQAYRISNGGQDFSQWATFTNHSYQTFLKGSGATTGGTPTPLGSGFALPSLNPLQPLQDIVANITKSQAWQWVTNPNRVLKMVVGIVLLAIAIAMLVSGNTSVKDVASQAKDILS